MVKTDPRGDWPKCSTCGLPVDDDRPRLPSRVPISAMFDLSILAFGWVLLVAALVVGVVALIHWMTC